MMVTIKSTRSTAPHLAVAKFSGNLGIRICNHYHIPLYKSYSNLEELYRKIVDLIPRIIKLYYL